MSEDLATESQVRCFTALMHRLAEKEGREYKEIRKEIKERFGYSNLSRVDRETISTWIDELESELDGHADPNMNGHADTNADVDEQNAENADVDGQNADVDGQNADDPDIISYVQMLGKIYDAVQKEERVPDSDRLFAVRLVFEAISRDRRSRLIAELRR